MPSTVAYRSRSLTRQCHEAGFPGGSLHTKVALTRFPAGTLVVNVLGCLAIGLLLGVAGRSSELPESVRLLVVVGLLGSFTTFSTFGKETVDLVAQGAPGRALLVVLGNLALGLPAVWLGARLATSGA